MKDKRRIAQQISKHGSDILSSKEFKEAENQIHHYMTTVASHSLKTAMAGVEICFLLKKAGIRADLRKVVRTALLHDLGMVGRRQLYRNNYECCLRHPGNSAAISRQIWKDIDEKSLAAIESHMWPLSVHIPRTREAFVLCLADKIASVRDLITIIRIHKKGKEDEYRKDKGN
jgi:uncharacterized protein